jgi:hypothetical protein
MNKLVSLLICVVFAVLAGCQKQQSEEERKAEVERVVQQRLDAEHQAAEKDQLAQREADINAREKALAEKQTADVPATQTSREPVRERESRPSRTEERSPRRDEDRRPTGSYDTFYTKLDQYGDWRETSDYGYVFQPREAQSRNWRPYTDGRWVYTDVGWTWVSEEPFGWATYHYGRWTRLRNIGWVWVPGDEWAPAWVSWRKSDDYVGWAPLPPEARFDRRAGIHNWADNYYDIGPDQYCFVEARQFGGQRVQRDVVPTERNVTIINQTTNVTNITYNNTTVVNQGPNYDELRTRSTQPIERLKLERQVNIDVNVQAPQPAVRAGVVFIPAPLIARGQAVERPHRVKENVAQVTVEHGWGDIADKQAADKARAKMRSESTPPPDAPPKVFVKPVTQTSAASEETTTTIPPRSIPTPRESAAASLPVVAPTATPVSTPAVQRSTPARLVETPTPAPSVAPRDTPPIVRKRTPLPATTPATAAPSVSAEQTPAKVQEMDPRLKKLSPRRIAPMESPSIAPATESPVQSKGGWTGKAVKIPNESPSAASSVSTSESPSSAEKLTKKEKKELKREEKQERKRGAAGQGTENAAPSVSPSPAP